MPINIAITDDHPIVRNGLKTMLQTYPDLKVTATYGSGVALLAGLKQRQPDLLLLDIHLPDSSGSELLVQIRQLYPAVRIIIFTSSDSIYSVKLLLSSGARGYLLKTTNDEFLIHAIRKVMNENETVISPEIKELLVGDSLKQSGYASEHLSLTEREKSILSLIVEGHTSQEIGDKIHLSVRTVENYRLGLMQKLDAKNIASLVKLAIVKGLV